MTDRPHAEADLLTVAGLALLLEPVLTIAHEIGGHAATCWALGDQVTELGAYYVECAARDPVAGRLVSGAGTAVDALLAALAWALWRRASGDLARLILWYVFASKAMVAAGYLLYSGVTGIGDWGPGEGGGMGPLPFAAAWRVGLTVLGAGAYVLVVRLAMRSLSAMIGGESGPGSARRRIAIGFYLISGVVAVLVGLFNPHGLFITLASAAAASFGGTAGLINTGFARPSGPARAFSVRRSYPLLIAGLVAAALFAAILGPTVYLGR